MLGCYSGNLPMEKKKLNPNNEREDTCEVCGKPMVARKVNSYRWTTMHAKCVRKRFKPGVMPSTEVDRFNYGAHKV